MVTIPCQFQGPDHEYPDDWIFGGADATHPGADPRYRPTTYIYWTDRLVAIHSTVVPLCDDEALDYFTQVARWNPSFNPVWVSASRPQKDGTYVTESLPWTYDRATDTVTERES